MQEVIFMQLDSMQRQLVEDNLALVRKVIADKVHGAGKIGSITYEDLYQIGCIGLCKAVAADKFDYAHKDKNTYLQDKKRFCTFAYRVIWNEICTVLIGATKAKAEHTVDPDEADILAHEMQPGFDKGIAGAELRIVLEQMLADAEKAATGTTAKGLQAIRYMAEGYTSSEIAKIMGGTSCHHVTAWISKARRHIKSNPELMRLLQYSA